MLRKVQRGAECFDLHLGLSGYFICVFGIIYISFNHQHLRYSPHSRGKRE